MKVYETDNKQTHMKSYKLIQIMTSDKITCSFYEICYIKNNLYKFSNKEITDLNNFCDKYFKPFKE